MPVPALSAFTHGHSQADGRITLARTFEGILRVKRTNTHPYVFNEADEKECNGKWQDWGWVSQRSRCTVEGAGVRSGYGSVCVCVYLHVGKLERECV